MKLNGQPDASSAKVGVGLGGMQERLKQIGGKLVIHSDDTGTAVIATIPYAPVLAQSESPNGLHKKDIEFPDDSDGSIGSRERSLA